MPANSTSVRPEDFATVLDAMQEGLQIVDSQWRYIFLNPAAAAHGKRKPEELLGRTMMACYPGIEHTAMFALLERCASQGVSGRMENHFKYEDGKVGVFELRVEPCSLGLMILSIDVTESRRLEVQLHHAQKMEAVGRLAGSIAHDFNNLLTVILSYSVMLLDEMSAQQPHYAEIEAIRKAGERAAGLTRQLLLFSRQQLLAPQILNLNGRVRETEKILRRLLGEDIEVRTWLDADLPNVKGDPGQLDQVIMNLAINARDAMPKGGKVIIETKKVYLDESYAKEHLGIAPGCYAMMAMSDTGSGMDRETQARIFEPFFTTKEPGKGTGLGLSTVFGIVQRSGGAIWVYSEPGNGTTFRLYFPQALEAPVTAVAPTETRTLRGTETILLAEDQDDVREVAKQILRRYGYMVLDVSLPQEAMELSERYAHPIDLLLTDVVMPQMHGHELAKQISESRPQLRVLYMSGYTEQAIVHHGGLNQPVACIQKPLEPELLAKRVREVLDAPNLAAQEMR